VQKQIEHLALLAKLYNVSFTYAKTESLFKIHLDITISGKNEDVRSLYLENTRLSLEDMKISYNLSE
jgi:hypothetical protein